MSKKSRAKPKQITNRRARYDYELHHQLQVGIALTGPEVRAARDGHVSLRGAYVTLRDGNLWLLNASFTIPGTAGGKIAGLDTRSRQLLAKKQEILKLADAKDSGLTIVPLSLYNTGRYIKLLISTAKGKKLHDKREIIKQRDSERETRRAVKFNPKTRI